MSIIRKYHNHTLQTNPWQRKEEFFLPRQDDCKTRMDIKLSKPKQKPTQNPRKQSEAHQTINQQQQNRSLRKDDNF